MWYVHGGQDTEKLIQNLFWTPVIFKNAQTNQSPHMRKFAQSGHSGLIEYCASVKTKDDNVSRLRNRR
jgi:hypothetical protein